jgi:isocitrate lyase
MVITARFTLVTSYLTLHVRPACCFLLQFVTLAGFHALNYSMFTLAHDYAKRGMAAYAELQAAEFASEKLGYTATRHQGFVGTGYFDELAQVIAAGQASTTALTGSTEEEQF